MRTELVHATRSAFESGIDDDAAAVLLDLVAGFPAADRARELRSAIDELPRDWFESRIVEGGILDAAAIVAGIAEAYYRAGRPRAATAELLTFLEVMAQTLGRLTREMLAREEAELDRDVAKAAHGCGWRPRRSR